MALSRTDGISKTEMTGINPEYGVFCFITPGRLREIFEIEQSSLQLVDNVIEHVLAAGRALSLHEVHLVNLNHVTTQYITQALRTRAHTKVRYGILRNMCFIIINN